MATQTGTQTQAKTGTVRLHRVLAAPPERVYKAFLDPDAMAKWMPPRGFTGKVTRADQRVGGEYKMSFTNFGTGRTSGFGGKYLELTPHARLRYTDVFDDPNMPGQIVTTIELRPVMNGTDVTITQEGLPTQVPTEFAYMGWQESLDQLKALVEPNIPDEP